MNRELEPPPAPEGKPRVLLAEDEDDVRSLLQRELEEMGYPVTAVEDGLAARSRMRAEPYPLLITDIRMPGLDGVGLTRWVRKARPETEIIIITAFPSLESATEAVRLGATDYIIKPFRDLGQLQDSVALATDRYLARSRLRHVPGHDGALLVLMELLNFLPLGIIITDGKGHLLQLNRQARDLLQQEGGLLHNGDAQVGASLLQAVAHAQEASGGISQHGGNHAFTLEGHDRLSGFPVLARDLGSVDGSIAPSQRRVAIFIGDPRQRVSTTIHLLGRLFGLSVAEARVAQHLMRGLRVAEIADEIGITPNTVRVHLKQTYAKTGASQQSDLVSLLLNSPAALLLA